MDQSQVPPAPAPARRTSRMAVTSLVLGILSLLCLSVIAGIPAVILGHKARGRIQRSGGTLEGSGMALGGLITGYLSIVLLIIGGIFFATVYSAQKKAVACVNNLQQIEFAKEQWAMEAEPEPGVVPPEEELNAFLDEEIGQMVCPSGGTYSINPVGQKPTCSVPGHQLAL